jgi:FkbM family methyltransferase
MKNLIKKSKKAYNEGGISLFLSRSLVFTSRSLLPRSVIDYFKILIFQKCVPYPKDGEWILFNYAQMGRERKIPVLSEIHQCSEEHQNHLMRVYNKNCFVEVEEDDTVFDIGAYLGGFTVPASKKAEQVLAIDPNSKISDSLRFNTSELDNVEIIEKAVWKENKGEIEINKSLFPNDNSVLEPDEKELEESFKVEAKTISKIGEENNVETIDFLKVEAEGVEPEIVKNAVESDIHIKKFAVDTTAERNGEAPTDQIKTILKESGYKVKTNKEKEPRGGRIVYGKLQD